MKALESLRLRLAIYALVVVVAALIIAGFGILQLFERQAERRLGQELDAHLAQLAGALRFAADGTPDLRANPADPRFDKVFGGLYWQISSDTGEVLLRSRSLWDSELHLAADQISPGETHVHEQDGPAEQRVQVHERLLLFPTPTGKQALRIAVAIDMSEIDRLAQSFGREMVPALIMLGVALLVGFGVQVSAGLRPVLALQGQIAAIRDGDKRRLEGPVPTELQALADELNELLENQEGEMIRARDRAADMAHGLKTPLTALMSDVRRLRERGVEDVAADIEDVARRMQRHIDRELARARLRHGRAVKTDVAPVVQAITRTIGRTPQGENIHFESAIPEGFGVELDQDDLNELLGNLIENAARHARSKVTISAEEIGGEARISVEDDGDGLTDDKFPKVKSRGARLDTSGGSAGLGLAIVSDILEANGGRLEFDRSHLGGLRVNCILPERAVAG